MSRTLQFTIDRFDGGITENIRDLSDMSKCAHVSHFDIYRDSRVLFPMPGYVDDSTIGTTEGDLKQYDVRAFFYDGTLYAVGKKAVGTGSKLFEKAAPLTSAWTATTNGEGTDTTFDNTFLVKNTKFYFVTQDGSAAHVSENSGSGTTDAAATLSTSLLESTNDFLAVEQALDGHYYANTGNDDLIDLKTASIVDPALATIDTVTDMQSGDAQMAVVGYVTFPHTGVFTIWDLTANPNETMYRYNLGLGIPRAVGRVGSEWGVVIDEGIGQGSQGQLGETTNGVYAMNVALVSGAQVRSLARIEGAGNTNGKIVSSRGTHRGAMLFYARIAQDAVPTTYKEGVWALGLNKRGAPALSLLLDTSGLGSVERHYPVGYHHFFAHNGDGSVSRLDAQDGTYDETAVYESLVFGADSPYYHELGGVTVTTSPLPVGGSVVLKFRKDPKAGWTTLGSSVSEGATRHVFTRIDGVPIGRFPEIQFRLEVVGNAPVRGLHLTLTELDDLVY